MSDSRSKNTVRNSIFALLEQGIYSIMSFICRTVFIYYLGKTYLGFNGLFSDILNLLSLAEFGFGTAILYSMYSPMANNDEKKISALLRLYKKVYTIVGISITIVGVSITPFLNFFISDIPDISELPIIYLLYLLNTTSSYFFVYKKSILIVDQKNYIVSIFFIFCTLFQNVLQIVSLVWTKNFVVYLVIQVLCTISNNIAISIYVDKKYKFIKQYKYERISDEEKNDIFKNVKAMFLSKISSAVVSSTDNILISKFVSTIVLGVYSNYTLFTTILRTIMTKIFEGLTGSVGNLVSVESKEKCYEIFKRIWFVNYWIVAFFSLSIYILINPFIMLWLGEGFILNKYIVLIICVNFYMRFIRNTFITFTDTFGLFNEFKIKCVMEAVINFVVSIIFVSFLHMGIIGVLLGTFISNISTNYWFEPYILFRKKFDVNLNQYIITFFKYIISTIIAFIPTNYFCRILNRYPGWISFGLQVIVCIILINGILLLIYHKSDEYSYFKNTIYRFLRKKED